MEDKAAITVNRAREEVQRLWASPGYRPGFTVRATAAVTFKDAPGARGTEIPVDLAEASPAAKLGDLGTKLGITGMLPKVKDELRRFKQHVETGLIPRSEGSPE